MSLKCRIITGALTFLSLGGSFAMAKPALHEIVDSYAMSYKRLDAYYAPYFGVEELLGQFGDYPSPAYFDRLKNLCQNTLAKLNSIDQKSLSTKDLVLYRLLYENLEITLEGYHFSNELLAFNQMDNRLHTYIDDSNKDLTLFPFDTVAHYDAFIARSQGLGGYVDAQIEVLRRGIKTGITLTQALAERTIPTFQEGLEPNIEKNPFWRPIIFMPESFPEVDKKRLKEAFRKMIAEHIVPSFTKFDQFFRNEYLPNCRKSGFGIGDLPNGKAWYAHLIKLHTNLTLDPEQIHEMGLKEVARLNAAIDKVRVQLGFKGTLKEFVHSLSTDKKYFYKSSKELFDAFLDVKSKVAAKIPQYFSTVPKTDYSLVESSNAEDAAARYFDPTDIIPRGRFVVNTKNTAQVPKYDVTSLSLHEAVPGHHFQLALVYEMKDSLTEYQRKMFYSGSFIEGWALYAEYLGNEMGMYEDPMQLLGNLNNDILRAVRLVVDTGIHAKGWSREKVMAYMTEHIASDIGQISNEANRYAVMPGQALGYKLGQLKIIELRRVAEVELGKNFDLKEFHRCVIGNGTVSLAVLESLVHEWIATVKKSST